MAPTTRRKFVGQIGQGAVTVGALLGADPSRAQTPAATLPSRAQPGTCFT